MNDTLIPYTGQHLQWQWI